VNRLFITILCHGPKFQFGIWAVRGEIANINGAVPYNVFCFLITQYNICLSAGTLITKVLTLFSISYLAVDGSDPIIHIPGVICVIGSILRTLDLYDASIISENFVFLM